MVDSVPNPWQVSPTEAIVYFRRKGLAPTFDWRDFLEQEHSKAFTIAKMGDVDLLSYVQTSLTKALEDGVTYKEWSENLAPKLVESGWWGQKPLLDPVTGQVVNAQLGSSHRLETIYRTNMQTSYAVGAFEQALEDPNVAYAMYDAVDDYRTRDHHAELDEIVAPIDSDFFKYNTPPLGFNCRCRLIYLSDSDVTEFGLTPTDPELDLEDWTNPRTGQTVKKSTYADYNFGKLNATQEQQLHLQQVLAEKVNQLDAGNEASAKLGIGAMQDAIEESPANLNAQLAASRQNLATAKVSEALQGYRTALSEGRRPTEAQLDAYEALPLEAQGALDAQGQLIREQNRANLDARQELREFLRASPTTNRGRAASELPSGIESPAAQVAWLRNRVQELQGIRAVQGLASGYVYVANSAEKQRVISDLQASGVERWPDGRSLDDVVKVGR